MHIHSAWVDDGHTGHWTWWTCSKNGVKGNTRNSRRHVADLSLLGFVFFLPFECIYSIFGFLPIPATSACKKHGTEQFLQRVWPHATVPSRLVRVYTFRVCRWDDTLNQSKTSVSERADWPFSGSCRFAGRRHVLCVSTLDERFPENFDDVRKAMRELALVECDYHLRYYGRFEWCVLRIWVYGFAA